MEISQLLGQEAPWQNRLKEGEEAPWQNRLKELAEEAGQCEVIWTQNERATPCEIYDCPTADIHRSIAKEFDTQWMSIIREWLKRHDLKIVKPHLRHPSWLKRGGMTPPDRSVAVVIPLPSSTGENCEVLYMAKQSDSKTRKPLIWGEPILLEENSALILVHGSIKFISIDLEVDGLNQESVP